MLLRIVVLKVSENFQESYQFRQFSSMFSTYILRQDGCLWKINLWILWNHTMKNFQLKHGQFITNGETFFISYKNTMLFGGNLLMRTSFLHPPRKDILPSLSFHKKKIYLNTHLKKELTYLFWKLPGCSLLTQAA